MTTVLMEGPESAVAELQDFDRLMERYRPSVFRFLLASLRDRDDAETLTQDCFLRAFRHRDQFRGEAAVKTWLMQIAANLARDLTRTRRFQFWKRAHSTAVDALDLGDFLPARAISPEESALRREQVQAIWAATEHLSPRQREVFLLRFVEDLTMAEISAILGTTEGTVKKQLFRALHTVRGQMK